MSLTTLPPIRRSPLVCFSSPQMMRRNVVLPQPDGPSSTMNWPSGTVRLMPLTAETSPNFLTMSLVDTAAIAPPRIVIFDVTSAPPFPRAERRQCRLLSWTVDVSAERDPNAVDQVLPAHFLKMASH